MANKRQSPIRGDVFLIPLLDGSFTVGQVIEVTKAAMNSVLCAFFNLRGSRPQIESALPTEDSVISVQFVTPESLKRGAWQVIRNDRVSADVERIIPLGDLASKGYVGVEVLGSGIIKSFLNAFFGLAPWDDWHDPEFLDTLLAPGVKRPSNAVLTKS